MKKYIYLLPLLFISNLFSYPIRTLDGKVQVPAYTLKGEPVWSESDKADILSKSVNTGTGTIKDSDFIPVVISQEDKDNIADMSDDVDNGKRFYTRDEAEAEIEKRKSLDYINKKIKEKLLENLKFNDDGTIFVDTLKLNQDAKYQKLKTRKSELEK